MPTDVPMQYPFPYKNNSGDRSVSLPEDGEMDNLTIVESLTVLGTTNLGTVVSLSNQAGYFLATDATQQYRSSGGSTFDFITTASTGPTFNFKNSLGTTYESIVRAGSFISTNSSGDLVYLNMQNTSYALLQSSSTATGLDIEQLGSGKKIQFYTNSVCQAYVQDDGFYARKVAIGSSPTVFITQPPSGSNYNFNLPTSAGSSGDILRSGGGASNAMTWDSGTGSGAVVLTTSPLLTTPRIDTIRPYASYDFTFPVGAGTSGQVLTSSGGGVLTWTTPTYGTVTSVDMTVPSFLSVSGNPITSSGTFVVDYSGTPLPVANGGTGVTDSTGTGTKVVLHTNPEIVTGLTVLNGASTVHYINITNVSFNPTNDFSVNASDSISLIAASTSAPGILIKTTAAGLGIPGTGDITITTEANNASINLIVDPDAVGDIYLSCEKENSTLHLRTDEMRVYAHGLYQGDIQELDYNLVGNSDISTVGAIANLHVGASGNLSCTCTGTLELIGGAFTNVYSFIDASITSLLLMNHTVGGVYTLTFGGGSLFTSVGLLTITVNALVITTTSAITMTANALTGVISISASVTNISGSGAVTISSTGTTSLTSNGLVNIQGGITEIRGANLNLYCTGPGLDLELDSLGAIINTSSGNFEALANDQVVLKSVNGFVIGMIVPASSTPCPMTVSLNAPWVATTDQLSWTCDSTIVIDGASTLQLSCDGDMTIRTDLTGEMLIQSKKQLIIESIDEDVFIKTFDSSSSVKLGGNICNFVGIDSVRFLLAQNVTSDTIIGSYFNSPTGIHTCTNLIGTTTYTPHYFGIKTVVHGVSTTYDTAYGMIVETPVASTFTTFTEALAARFVGGVQVDGVLLADRIVEGADVYSASTTTINLNGGSAAKIIFTGGFSGTQPVVLPNLSSSTFFANGYSFEIYNDTDCTVSVSNYTGSIVATLGARSCGFLVCKSALFDSWVFTETTPIGTAWSKNLLSMQSSINISSSSSLITLDSTATDAPTYINMQQNSTPDGQFQLGLGGTGFFSSEIGNSIIATLNSGRSLVFLNSTGITARFAQALYSFTTTVEFNNVDQSTNITTGGVIVKGGLGIAKNTNIGGVLHIYDTTQSTSAVTGCAIFDGGVGIAKDLWIAGNYHVIGTSVYENNVTITGANSRSLTIQSTNNNEAAYCIFDTIVGGVSKTVYTGVADSLSTGAGHYIIYTSSGQDILHIINGATITTTSTTGITHTKPLHITDTTNSIDPTSGCTILDGGLGVAKEAWFGDDINITGASSRAVNISSTDADMASYVIISANVSSVTKAVFLGIPDSLSTGAGHYVTSVSSGQNIIDIINGTIVTTTTSTGITHNQSVVITGTTHRSLTIRSTNSGQASFVVHDVNVGGSQIQFFAGVPDSGAGVGNYLIYCPSGKSIYHVVNGSIITITSSSAFTSNANVIIDATTQATSTTSASLQTDGGLGVVKDFYHGGVQYNTKTTGTSIFLNSTDDATNSATGSIVSAGGAGFAKNVYSGQSIYGSNHYLTGNGLVCRNTSDGTDDGYIILSGGGADGSTRGGRIVLSGNERTGEEGNIEIKAGDATLGEIKFTTGSDSLRGKIEKVGILNWSHQIKTSDTFMSGGTNAASFQYTHDINYAFTLGNLPAGSTASDYTGNDLDYVQIGRIVQIKFIIRLAYTSFAGSATDIWFESVGLPAGIAPSQNQQVGQFFGYLETDDGVINNVYLEAGPNGSGQLRIRIIKAVDTANPFNFTSYYQYDAAGGDLGLSAAFSYSL